MDGPRNVYCAACSGYDYLAHSSERPHELSVRSKAWDHPYLPRPNSLVETSLEAPPSLHITRVNTAYLERFRSAAYLLSPKFVQVYVTLSNLAEHRLYLTKQVKVFR